MRTSKSVFTIHEHVEAITDLTFSSDLNYLLSTSNDGCLGVYDLKQSEKSKDKLYAMSDNMETDLNQVCLVKNGKYVVNLI